MKAVRVSQYGGIEVLRVEDNVPRPAAGKGQVLVEVHAAGLNPFDLKVLSGAYRQLIPLKFPLTFGGDFAGTIPETGEEVFGTAIVLAGGSGAYAQFAVANPDKIAPKPKQAGFIAAAALPVAGLTAVEAILDHIRLRRGQKILIHGGGGGVGHLAIQLAKSIGAYVATTVSGKDKDFVAKLGADMVIDYQAQAFETRVKDFDGVIDTVGADVSDRSYSVLKSGGTLVLLVSQTDEALAQRYGVKVIRQQSRTDTAQLKRLGRLVDSGKIKVHVDRVFPLDQVKAAFTHLQTGHPKGKVVLRISA